MLDDLMHVVLLIMVVLGTAGIIMLFFKSIPLGLLALVSIAVIGGILKKRFL